MQSSRGLRSFAALLFSVFSTLAVAQSFVNGGFETPNLPMDSGGALTNGWTLTGCGGMATGGSMQNSGYPGATEGLQLGFYCADANIRQSLSLAAGYYQISFKGMGNASYPGVAVKVLMNNVALGTPMGLAGAAWNAYTTPVFQVASAGTVEFKFATADPAVWGYVYMDDVRITPVAAPTVAFVNGGFEAPALAPGSAGALSGWTLAGSTGATFTSGSFTSIGYPASPEGGQHGLYGTDSSLRQTLALAAGNHQIKFRAMGSLSYPGVAVKLTMDGVQIGTNMAIPGGVWQEFTAPVFAATAGSHLFAFGAANPATWGYVYIDDIRISALPNSAPTVSVTQPANNSTFVLGAPITLRAVASDPDGSVQSVDFFDGATLLATLTVPSGPATNYTYTWPNAGVGTHAITARATDNLGAVTTSAPITVTVTCGTNAPPSISLSSARNGEVISSPGTINLSATANDSDGIVTRVEFYQGTTKIGEDLAAPYSFSWSGVAPGNYSITAVATDSCGAQATSNAISVGVVSCASGGNNPVISLTSPFNGQHLTAPADVPVAASVSDADSDMAKVEFFSDGVKIGERNSPPYSMTIANVGGNTSRYISARATDACGLTATTTSAEYHVDQPVFSPVKEPECVGGAFTTGLQYLDTANNGVPANTWSMLMRWQSLSSQVPDPPPSVSEDMSPFTGFPQPAAQVGVHVTAPAGAPTGLAGTQLSCNGGGMLINTWVRPTYCVLGGGYNDMYGYSWSLATAPDAFVSRFSDGTVYQNTDLVLQADMGVKTFAKHTGTIPREPGDPTPPHGQFALFAYVYDVTSPLLHPIAILGAAYMPGGQQGSGIATDYSNGVWFVSASTGPYTGLYATHDPASSDTVDLEGGTYEFGSARFFRLRITAANWMAAINYINTQPNPRVPNGPNGYSMDVGNYRILYAGVIAEVVAQPSRCSLGTTGDAAQDQVVFGTHVRNFGVYRKY